MNDSWRRIERLTLPRARAEPDGVEQPIPEARSPLPRWQTIPLDAKFPVVPAPKGEVTFVTTKLGETPYKSTQKKDFDLSDPYNRTINTEYRALFDPYLKGWFSKPHIQKQMRKNKLLTERGNVPCSIRDFNEYRLFLRKQALMAGGTKGVIGEEEVDRAKERKKAVLNKTKMKAEVFGVEVKYRSLKAQQAVMEQEEERRKKYLKRTASQEDRLKQKVLEEEKQYFKALKHSQQEWTKKLEKIKERDVAMRRRAEQKLVQFELEAQDKLNKLDYLREQRFQMLDQKRKLRWRQRRMAQAQEMQEAKLQKQRVDAEMRTIKQRYENQLARQAARNEVALDNAKEIRFRMKERDNETYARRIAQVLKNSRYMTFGSPDPQGSIVAASRRASRIGETNLTRQASIWMVQEVLLRLGLSEESRRLKRQHFSSVAYLNDLDSALSMAVRRLEGTTVLGEEQEMLSRLVHLVWRGVKTAYPGKTAYTEKTAKVPIIKVEQEESLVGETPAGSSIDRVESVERSIMETTMDEDITTGEQLAWFFPDNDDGVESEEAVKISMLITGEMERQLPLPTILGDDRPRTQSAQRQVDERMDQFFKTRMRMTETDALAAEAELIRFLNSLKESEVQPIEMKKILDMCIRLANHDVIKRSEPCGELETNPDNHTYLAFEPEDDKAERDDGKRPSSSSVTGKETSRAQRASSSVVSKLETVQTGELESAPEADGDVASTDNPQNSTSAAAAAEEGMDATQNASSGRFINQNMNRNNVRVVSTATNGESRSNSNISRTSNSSSDSSNSSSSNTDGRSGDRASRREDGETSTGSVLVGGERASSSATSRSDDDLSRSSRASDCSDSTGKYQRGDRSEDTEAFESHDPGNLHEPNISENKAGEDSALFGAGNVSQNMMEDDPDAGNEGLEQKEQKEEEKPADQIKQELEGEEQKEERQGELEEREEGELQEKQDAADEAPSAAFQPSEDIKQENLMDELKEPVTDRSTTLAESVTSQQTKSQSAVPGFIDEDTEEVAFEKAVEDDDVVAIAEQMLIKIQEREKVKGVSIPQSRLLRFVAMNLSRLWRPGPDDHLHMFGSWLTEPTVPETIRSLIYNIKRRKFPEELQRSLAKGVVSVFLEGVASPATPLTDGLVKTVLDRFISDLEKDQVCLPLLENVLRVLVEEYSNFIRMDIAFNSSVLVLDCLGFLQDLVISGEVTKKSHILPAVRNWNSLSGDNRDTLECGHWDSLLHQASVAIRLNLLTEDDQKNLLALIKTVCIEKLPADAFHEIKEMLDMMRNLNTLREHKVAFSIDLGVNTVALLLKTMQTAKITSTTLLPGIQNTSQSACTDRSPSVLGPYSTGEAVIVLVLDKLASDMGNGHVSPLACDQMAASLVDLLVTNHGRRREELKGQGLMEALDELSSQLESHSLSYRDVKNIFAAVLRPYLATTVRPLLAGIPGASDQQGVDRGPPPESLDEAQSRSLLALVTQLYAAFTLRAIERSKRAGVGVEVYSRKIMSLFVWRAMAQLAKQAKAVLTEIEGDLKNEAVTSRVKPSDSLIIERILRTVVDMEETPGMPNGQASVVTSEKPTLDLVDAHENIYGNANGNVSSGFLRAVLTANPKPGYIPLPQTSSKQTQRKSTARKSGAIRDTLVELEYTAEELAIRAEKTPLAVDRTLRREIIAAARDIGDSLISTKALRQLTTKTADSFTGMVFVIEKLLDNLYGMLWSRCEKIQRGKMSPDALVASLIGSEHCEDVPQLRLDTQAAIRVLHEAVLEMESQHASALTMSRMVESLSRAAHGLVPASSDVAAAAHLRRQPHPILASASPILLAQWVRACLLAALRAVTVVISGGRRSSAMMPKPVDPPPIPTTVTPSTLAEGRPVAANSSVANYPRKQRRQQVDLDGIQLAASYVVVHNLLASIHNDTEHQKSPDGLWLAPRVAGTRERSQVGVPYEILDRVFARLAGVMQTLGDTSTSDSPEDNDGRVPERACDVASTIISQVTSAVSYHVEVGKFPLIRINDLLRGAKPSSGKEKGSKKKQAGGASKAQAAAKGVATSNAESNNRQLGASNNNWSMNNNFSEPPRVLQDPVAMMQGRWSSYLFHSLVDVVARLDAYLKAATEDSMQRQEAVTTDARVRARAFTSATLDKILKHASSGEFLLHNGRDSIYPTTAITAAQMWRSIQDDQFQPESAPSAAVSATATARAAGTVTSSPAASRKPSQAMTGPKSTKIPSANTNVNKSRTCNVGVELNKPRNATKTPSTGKCSTTATTAAKRSTTSLIGYVRSLLRPVNDADCGDIFSSGNISKNSNSGNVSNNKSGDVISEILQAGYAVSMDLFQAFEQPEKLNRSESSVTRGVNQLLRHRWEKDEEKVSCNGPGSTAISILVLDLLLGHLSSSLEQQNKCVQGVTSSNTVLGRGGQAGKRGGPAAADARANPYVSSYQYRTPDPYGRFYAEVVDRGRRWCQMQQVGPAVSGAAPEVDVPRIHSLTRELLAAHSEYPNDQPPQPVAGGQDLTGSAASGAESLTSEPSLTQQNSRALKGIEPRRQGNQQDRERRSFTWRKQVHKISATYAVDNKNNSWHVRPRTHLTGKSGSTGAIFAAVTGRAGSGKPKSGFQKQGQSSGQTGIAYPEAQCTRRGCKEVLGDKKTPAVGARRHTSVPVARLTGPVPKYGSSRGPPGTCSGPLTRRRTTGADKVKDCEDQERPEEPVTSKIARHVMPAVETDVHHKKKQQQKQQIKRSSLVQCGRQPAPRQEARVEVIYHVPEGERAVAEEQLKKYREQSESEASEAPALCDLDLQLLVLALLSRDLPREVSIMAACLQGQDRVKVSGLEDVADLLSLLDHVLDELKENLADLAQRSEKTGKEKEKQREEEDERSGIVKNDEDDIEMKVKVKRLLKAAGKKLEVSQWSAGAVHSLLRSLECGMLEDVTIAAGLESCSVKVTKKLSKVNLLAVRSQLKSSLAQLVERLEEGHAPSCLTSSDWTRLANEVVQQMKQPPELPEEETELHQSPSHCSKHDEDDEHSYDDGEGNQTDYDEMNSFEYFDQDQDKSPGDVVRHPPEDRQDRSSTNAGSRNPEEDRPEKAGVRDTAGSHSSKSRSRSGSRSGSRSVTRYVSRSPPRCTSARRDEAPSSRTEDQREDPAGRAPGDDGDQQSPPPRSKAKYEGSWSPNKLPSASCSSSSSSSSSTSSSLSASSLSSMSSASSYSTSCCSAASHASGRACSVTLEKAARHAQSKSPLIRDPEINRGFSPKADCSDQE